MPAAAQEEAKDAGDIFRNTGMKFNEAPQEKKARMARALNALKNVDIGKASAFVGF